MKQKITTVVALLATMGLIVYLSQNPRTPSPEIATGPAWTPAPITPAVQEPVTKIKTGEVKVAQAFGCYNSLSFGFRAEVIEFHCNPVVENEGIATLATNEVVTARISVTQGLKVGDTATVTRNVTMTGQPTPVCTLKNQYTNWDLGTTFVISEEMVEKGVLVSSDCTFENGQTVHLAIPVHFAD